MSEYTQTSAHDQPTAAEDAHTIMINRVAWGAALNTAAINALRQLVTGDDSNADEARQQAAQALAQARKIPLDQAREQVAQIEQQYRQTVAQAKQAATEAADTTVSIVSTGALAAFVALVLGAVAGWFGGRSGVVHPVFADGLSPHRVKNAR